MSTIRLVFEKGFSQRVFFVASCFVRVCRMRPSSTHSRVVSLRSPTWSSSKAGLSGAHSTKVATGLIRLLTALASMLPRGGGRGSVLTFFTTAKNYQGCSLIGSNLAGQVRSGRVGYGWPYPTCEGLKKLPNTTCGSGHDP